MSDKLDKEALDYHRYPVPGKLQVTATKPLANQYDLSLAYSPGVAAVSYTHLTLPTIYSV